MSDTDSEIHKLLDEAAEKYHALRGDRRPDRAEQFDAHLATVRMVVDHTADEITKPEPGDMPKEN